MLVLLRTVGLMLFGVEQDTAITNADPSPLTFGIDDPTTDTIWLERAGIVAGLNDEIVA